MLKRALEGYEKALGKENAKTYPQALTTIRNLGALFEDQADFSNAKIMYLKAMAGQEKVFGPDHPDVRDLRDRLRALDALTEDIAPTEMKEPENNS